MAKELTHAYTAVEGELTLVFNIIYGVSSVYVPEVVLSGLTLEELTSGKELAGTVYSQVEFVDSPASYEINASITSDDNGALRLGFELLDGEGQINTLLAQEIQCHLLGGDPKTTPSSKRLAQ